MKLIFNPENGATIKNIWYKDAFYFDEKDNLEFVPGMVIRVDDAFGEHIKNTWEFVTELTPEEAKEYMDTKEDFKCEKCEYRTKVKIAYYGHKRKHDKEAAIDSLGIRTIETGKPAQFAEDLQKQIDAEDHAAGLIGEGLVDETPKKGAVM